MAINSDYDFVGGYEHDSEGGLLHVANHHVSPGKKQWTWGHSDFGQAWDRNLTDEDGPYIELMTGMFTDNQPDFTWLLPNEEKSFTQYFLPYKELGLVKNATKDLLVTLNKDDRAVNIKVYGTSVQPNITIKLTCKKKVVFEDKVDINPREIFQKSLVIEDEFNEDDLVLTLQNSSGTELISYAAAKNKINDFPAPAQPALAPADIKNNEQLFLTGQHLEQYRHATYHPVPYYEQALKNDPGDIRCNNALGLWYLRRGQFAKSERYFKTAIETSISRNPNPYDTEVYYNLGICCKFLNKVDEAYKSFYKSTWGKAWQDSGYFEVAKIDLSRGDYELAIKHLDLSLQCNTNNSKAYVLKANALRKLHKVEEATSVVGKGLEVDSFNLGAWFERSKCNHVAGSDSINEIVRLSRGESQNFISYALDYANAGLYDEAIEFLNLIELQHPIVFYCLAYFNFKLGDKEKMDTFLKSAQFADSYLCFPNRLEEINILKLAVELNPSDAKAPYYLGNLFYDKRQYTDAIAYWELSAKIDPNFPTALRNLGIAYHNKLNDGENALACFEKAFRLDQSDARVLMELDQLYKRLNKTPEERNNFLVKHIQTVNERDDLYLEQVTLLNFLGQHEQALHLVSNRQFHPWEGGEGKASGQFLYSLIELAKQAIQHGDFEKAIQLLTTAQVYPHNLGEGKLFGTQENDIFYWLGCAYKGLNDDERAHFYFSKATIGLAEPSAAMFYNDQQPDKIFYQGLAWIKLNEPEKAERIFTNLVTYGNTHVNDDVKLDYFAVSLPNLLIFEDDLNLRNKIHCKFMIGLGLLGLEKTKEAAEQFEELLRLDEAHQGAKSHLTQISNRIGKLKMA